MPAVLRASQPQTCTQGTVELPSSTEAQLSLLLQLASLDRTADFRAKVPQSLCTSCVRHRDKQSSPCGLGFCCFGVCPAPVPAAVPKSSGDVVPRGDTEIPTQLWVTQKPLPTNRYLVHSLLKLQTSFWSTASAARGEFTQSQATFKHPQQTQIHSLAQAGALNCRI